MSPCFRVEEGAALRTGLKWNWSMTVVSHGTQAEK